MTIRRADGPILPGASQRLEMNGGGLPFRTVDTNGKGSISKEELTNAVRLNFPTLTDLEASAIAAKAFDAGSKNGKTVTASGWQKAERIVLGEASITLSDKANIAATAGTNEAWGPRGRPPAEQAPLPPNYQMPPAGYDGNSYQPRNDMQTNGQPPYQYPPPMPEEASPAKSAGKAAGRGLLGFLKMIPGVSNIINGIDFVRDIGKGISTWTNPNKSFAEKLKAGADLLFHGVGMIAPQVGGAYDMAQSAARLGAAGAAALKTAGQELPPWQMNNGGYPTQYPMQYGNQPQNGMQQQQSYQSPNAYPQYPNSYNPNDPSLAPQQGEGSMPGLVRAGVGAAKMVPILGNVLNGLDTLRDAGRVVKNLFTGHPLKALKASADMLFHGVGTVIPQVGGAYDMAQGLVRAAAAQPSIPSWAQQAYQPDPWSSLPAWNPSYGPDITDQAIRSIGALREPAIPGPDASPQELAQYEKDSKRYDRAMELYSSIIKKRDELQMSLIRKM